MPYLKPQVPIRYRTNQRRSQSNHLGKRRLTLSDADQTMRARGPQRDANGQTAPTETRSHTDRLITVDETATLLAVTPAAIRRWLSTGRLSRVKVGRLTRLRLSDVEAVVVSGLPSSTTSY
jgi:excisionase family DNA binding protein